MVETVLFCLQSGHPRRKHVQCTARRRADTFMYAGPRAQYKLVQLLHHYYILINWVVGVTQS